jgi:hypothetical protein
MLTVMDTVAYPKQTKDGLQTKVICNMETVISSVVLRTSPKQIQAQRKELVK